jgi:cold shock CspA family protein
MVEGDIETLASKIVRDECVFFAGAGLSLHAGAPDWDSLVESAKEEFDYDSPLNDNFQVLFDIANQEGRDELHDFVRGRIPDVELEPPVKNLASLPWFATFTTNYDTALEDALSNYHDSVRVISEGSEFAISGSPSDLLCVKLMGSVEKRPDQSGSMVLTKGEMAKARDERSRIFEMLASHAANMSFLFVGYSFRDELFTEMIERIATEIGSPEDTYYALFRSEPPEERLYYLEQLGVEPIIGDIEDFSEELVSEVSKLDPSDHRTKRIPLGNKIIQLSLDDIGDFIESNDPVLYEELTTKVDPREFFKGNISSFRPFSNDWHFTRPEEDQIVNRITDSQTNIVAISGSPGSGRTFLISGAVQKAIDNKRALGFRIPSHSIQSIPNEIELESFIETVHEEAEEIGADPPEEIVFFSYHELEPTEINKFRRVADDLKYSLTLLIEASDGFEFPSEIAESSKHEKIPLENKIPSELHSDIKQYLIDTVNQHKFPELTEAEADAYLAEDPEFLPLMYKAVDPAKRSIQNIIQEEYTNISSERAKQLVNIVSLSYSLGVKTPVTVCRKVLSHSENETITFPDVFELADKEAKEFITTSRDARTNYLFSIYHPIVAKYLCNTFSQDPANLLSLLVNSVDMGSRVEAEFISRLLISEGVNRNISEHSPFSREELKEALTELASQQPARPILHHLARLKEEQGDPEEKIIETLEEALANPGEEYALEERKENILTTLANLKWSLNKDRLKNLDKDHEDIVEIFGYLEGARENVENIHTYDIQARILKQMANARPREERTELINQALTIIEAGLDREGDPDDMRQLKNRKIELLNGLDRERSEELAEELFEKQNSGEGYYTLARLALYDDNDRVQALRYLSQAMQAESYPAETIALRIRLLLEDHDPYYDMVYELVKELDGRADHTDTWKSAYHKAMTYLMNGEYRNAKRHFDESHRMAPWDLQRRIDKFWMEGGNRKVFEGKIGSPLSSTEGWIYAHGIDGWNDDIYFSPKAQDTGSELRSGRQVKFEVGFSPRGPQAFELEII